MKKTLFPIVLVSALMTIISCAKSFDAQEEGLVASSESKTFTATIESDGTKTQPDYNSDTKQTKVKWEVGDEISINGVIYVATPDEQDATKATFDKKDPLDKAPTGPYTAYYPAKLYNGGAPTLPSAQIHGTFALNPMYASSTTKSLSFKNICSVLKITTTESLDNSTISLSADKPLNGEFEIDNNNNAKIKATSVSGDNNKITLTSCSGEGPFYIAIPAQAYTYLTIKVTDNNSASKSMLKKMPSFSLARNTIYKLTFVPNEFTVDAKGKKVFFSPGNFYYDGSALRFETSQWATSTSWDPSHVSHFYWTDNLSKSAAPSYPEGDGSIFFFADDGHKLHIDGMSGWYALTSDEWNHLIKSRTINGSTGFGYTCICKEVNGVNGLVIFPDNYTLGTSASWKNMEEAGCVFLPAAGYRFGSIFYNVGDCGYYWSSSVDKKMGSYDLDFDGGHANLEAGERGRGLSVRLVRDSE